ncbi:MAG: hypothetical protein IPG75_14655 [Gemmatimonadetes bacterium]|nr:hypothetical protein [Gemmatimonadota bacterium]
MTSFDVGPFALHNLGLLDVGVTDTTDVGNDDSALELAQVLFRTDGWRVVFHQPVVLRPNQDTRQVVKPRNGAITFALAWVGSRRSRDMGRLPPNKRMDQSWRGRRVVPGWHDRTVQGRFPEAPRPRW